MILTAIGIALLAVCNVILGKASSVHKETMAMLATMNAKMAAEATERADTAPVTESVTAPAVVLEKSLPPPVALEDEPYVLLSNGMMGRASEYETRADGKLVRKDRFKIGFGNIVTILVGSRSEYEIDDIVEKVRAIAVAARADHETGGHGVPGSAPVWGPCPANCDDGLVRSGQECDVCDGRGQVVVEQPTVFKPESSEKANDAT